MTFAELLTDRLAFMDTSQAEFARRVTDAGIDTTRQAVGQWVAGIAHPEPWKWRTLLNILGIATKDRPAWETALQARPSARAAS